MSSREDRPAPVVHLPDVDLTDQRYLGGELAGVHAVANDNYRPRVVSAGVGPAAPYVVAERDGKPRAPVHLMSTDTYRRHLATAPAAAATSAPEESTCPVCRLTRGMFTAGATLLLLAVAILGVNSWSEFASPVATMTGFTLAVAGTALLAGALTRHAREQREVEEMMAEEKERPAGDDAGPAEIVTATAAV